MRSASSALQHYALIWRGAGPELRGILLMCVSTLGFAVMHTLIRYTSHELHPFQIAFFRNVFGFLVFLPILVRTGGGFLRTQRIGLHAARGALNICAMLMFFYALSVVEVARATALAFSAPVFAGILSVVFLGERFRLHRWSAIAAGFLGMLVILRPGLIPLELGPLLVVASSLLWATVMILIKIMSRTEFEPGHRRLHEHLPRDLLDPARRSSSGSGPRPRAGADGRDRADRHARPARPQPGAGRDRADRRPALRLPAADLGRRRWASGSSARSPTSSSGSAARSSSARASTSPGARTATRARP